MAGTLTIKPTDAIKLARQAIVDKLMFLSDAAKCLDLQKVA